MSEIAKNQYRCETCEHKTCDLSNKHLEECKQSNILDVGRLMIMRCTTEIYGCASHSSFTNSTEHLNNLMKHFESMDDHEELYLCDIIELLKGKKKI